MSGINISYQPKMQTLAQAHRYLKGKVPHRHNDVPNVNIESNIIFNTEGLYYVTFPKALTIPCGFYILCTVQAFVDFKPAPKMAELFESDWRICSASGTYNMWSKMIDKGWKK